MPVILNAAIMLGVVLRAQKHGAIASICSGEQATASTVVPIPKYTKLTPFELSCENNPAGYCIC